MIILRWVAILWAALCLVGLFFAPHGWPSTILVVAFASLFTLICWTFSPIAAPSPDSRKDLPMPTLDAARERLSAARTAVIRAEDALTNAIRRRDEAEQALYRAERDDIRGLS